MKIRSSEITPEHVYASRPSRRAFLKLALTAAGGAGLAACAPSEAKPTATGPAPVTSGKTDELGDALTSFDNITHYNNYYEFTTEKEGVADLAADFTTDPWSVEVGGLVNKPKTFGLEDIRKAFTSEERIYRMRCVEAWSMVIPWNGFSLSEILNQVEPTSDAKYVKFTAVSRPEEMPGMMNPLMARSAMPSSSSSSTPDNTSSRRRTLQPRLCGMNAVSARTRRAFG